MIGLVVIGLMLSPREEPVYVALINLHVIVVMLLSLRATSSLVVSALVHVSS